MKEHTLLAESLSYILVGYLYIKLMYYRKEKLSEVSFYYTEIIIGLFFVCIGIKNSTLILLGISLSIGIKDIVFYGAFFILAPISYFFEKHNLEKLNIDKNKMDKLKKNKAPSAIYYTDIYILIMTLLLIFSLYSI